jgi:hypothetical protein
MFGVGHHHVEESAVDQGELAFRIEPDRLVVVGERAIVLSDVPKQTGATVVGLPIPRLQSDQFVEIGKGAFVVALPVQDDAANEIGLLERRRNPSNVIQLPDSAVGSSFFRNTMARQ